MKTHYRILWIDDDMESVEDDISDIEDFFERYGIEPNIIRCESHGETDIHQSIKDELGNLDLDLIVVDYRMPGMSGSELIRDIRDTEHIFLPVIFYSTAGSAELHQQAAEASLDGVYIAGRALVKNKVELVVTSLLRKEQSSKRTRGLLMEGVSEIDANFGQLFLLFWDKLDDTQKTRLVAYLEEKVIGVATDKNKLVASLPSDLLEFRAFMKDHFVSGKFDTIMRWKVLKKLFELLSLTGDTVDVFHRLFDKKNDTEPLIPLRNQYGHKTREELEKSHDQDICIRIRRELRTQMKNIVSMSSD